MRYRGSELKQSDENGIHLTLTIKNVGFVVTFLTVSDWTRPGNATAPMLSRPSRSLSLASRKRSFDEDGARRAMGIESGMPSASLPGVALEDLARIAWG